MGVDPSGFGPNQGPQTIQIRRFQLGQQPVFQQFVDDRMAAGQTLQNFRIGGIAGFRLFSRRQTQLFKQNRAQLFGGIYIEGFPGKIVDFLEQDLDPTGDFALHAIQFRLVNLNAQNLHRGQRLHQRQFDFFQQIRGADPLQGLLLRRMKFRQFRCHPNGIRGTAEFLRFSRSRRLAQHLRPQPAELIVRAGRIQQISGHHSVEQ